ncbi:hypothetical protein [Asanoa sp. NPDC050611]|uniref:hypothetical protein n=1 Tax=Asanoa sp. NPDC050611 TaxID=3157098 RepID=UPI0033FB6535
MTFRRPGWRRLMVAILVGLPVLPIAAVIGAAFGHPWIQASNVVLLAGFVIGYYLLLGREPGLPLTLTDDCVVLIDWKGDRVETAWDNVAVAEVRGRVNHTLVLEVDDPQQVRPVLGRWQWGAHGRWSTTSRIERPYEIRVALVGMTPSVGRLRAEIKQRMPAR